MSKVVTTFTSDDKEVAASIDKMNRKLDDLTEKNKKLAEQAAAGAQKTSSGFGALAGSVADSVTGYAALLAAVKLVNVELTNRVELEEKARKAQLDTAQAEREFLRGYAPKSGTDRDAIVTRVRGISDRTGVPLRDVYSAGGSALSASGGNANIALDALERAAGIAPENAQVMDQIAGAIIDLGKSTGKFDNVKGESLIVALGNLSRGKDWGQIATNAPRGVIGSSASGFSPDAGAALVETLSNAMGDKDLAVSATAASGLAGKLRAFLPEEDIYSYGAKGKKTLKSKGVGAMSGEDRLLAIANDPEMRTKFLGGLEQSETKPFVELLMTPGTQVHEMFKSLIPQQNISQDEIATFKAVTGGTALQQTADLERRSQTAIDNALINGTEAARFNIIREKIDQAAMASGHDGMTRHIRGWEAWGRSFVQSPEGMGIQMIEGALQSERNKFGQHGQLNEQELEKVIAERNKPLLDILEVLKRMEQNQPTTNSDVHVGGTR